MARKLLIVGLVLLLILLIIPVGLGSAMGMCPECPAAGFPMTATTCLILLAAEILILAIVVLFGLSVRIVRPPGFALVRGLERPPRSS